MDWNEFIVNARDKEMTALKKKVHDLFIKMLVSVGWLIVETLIFIIIMLNTWDITDQAVGNTIRWAILFVIVRRRNK